VTPPSSATGINVVAIINILVGTGVGGVLGIGVGGDTSTGVDGITIVAVTILFGTGRRGILATGIGVDTSVGTGGVGFGTGGVFDTDIVGGINIGAGASVIGGIVINSRITAELIEVLLVIGNTAVSWRLTVSLKTFVSGTTAAHKIVKREVVRSAPVAIPVDSPLVDTEYLTDGLIITAAVAGFHNQLIECPPN
jgi:hypothetical protein